MKNHLVLMESGKNTCWGIMPTCVIAGDGNLDIEILESEIRRATIFFLMVQMGC